LSYTGYDYVQSTIITESFSGETEIDYNLNFILPDNISNEQFFEIKIIDNNDVEQLFYFYLKAIY